MPENQMRGMFPILITPFDKASRIDVDSLQSLVEFLIGAGVHGVGVALGSEVFKFTEDERRLVTRTVVGQARGRLVVYGPVVDALAGNSRGQARVLQGKISMGLSSPLCDRACLKLQGRYAVT